MRQQLMQETLIQPVAAGDDCTAVSHSNYGIRDAAQAKDGLAIGHQLAEDFSANASQTHNDQRYVFSFHHIKRSEAI